MLCRLSDRNRHFSLSFGTDVSLLENWTFFQSTFKARWTKLERCSSLQFQYYKKMRDCDCTLTWAWRFLNLMSPYTQSASGVILCNACLADLGTTLVVWALRLLFGLINVTYLDLTVTVTWSDRDRTLIWLWPSLDLTVTYLDLTVTYLDKSLTYFDLTVTLTWSGRDRNLIWPWPTLIWPWHTLIWQWP